MLCNLATGRLIWRNVCRFSGQWRLALS